MEENRMSLWFPVKQNFVVELEFDSENDTTAALLFKSLLRDDELLPNLKVKKIYRSIDSVENVFDSYKNEYEKIFQSNMKEILDSFFEIYKNKFNTLTTKQEVDVSTISIEKL